MGSQSLQVQHCLTKSNFQRSINTPQRVLVGAYERVHVPATNAINKKRSRYKDFFPNDFRDTHIGYKAPGTRPGELSMGMTALQTLDPRAEPCHIIAD